MNNLSQIDIENEFGDDPKELTPFEIQEMLEYDEMESMENEFYQQGELI